MRRRVVAMSDVIIVNRLGAVVRIRFNRPDRRNALSLESLRCLSSALRDAGEDDTVKCVVLQGDALAFSAGGDVKQMADGEMWGTVPFEDRLQWQRRNQAETVGNLFTMPKPTIALLEGPAAGAGLAFALACDLRFATSNAVLVAAFAGVGLSGDYGAAWFLSRLAGPSVAKDLWFRNRRITANEALRLGLINEIVEDPARFEQVISQVVDTVTPVDTGTLRAMKRTLNASLDIPLMRSLDLEAEAHLVSAETAAHKELVRRYLHSGAR